MWNQKEKIEEVSTSLEEVIIFLLMEYIYEFEDFKFGMYLSDYRQYMFGWFWA